MLVPAVNYGSCLWPLPFPAPFHHRVVQQTFKMVFLWSLQGHQTCNSSSFHAATKPFRAKQQISIVHGIPNCAWYAHKKHETPNDIVRCMEFSQQNSMHTSQHQHIYYRKLSLQPPENSLSHILTHSCSLAHILTHSCSLSHILTRSCSLSHILTHSCFLSHILTHLCSRSHILTHLCSRSHILTHLCSLSHILTFVLHVWHFDTAILSNTYMCSLSDIFTLFILSV